MSTIIPPFFSGVIYITRSWAQPHVVNFSKHWRFYSRNSAGKYPLDISEVRTAFNLSETVAERIRSFRTERLGKIVAGETPILLSGKARTVLHIVPINSISVSAEVFDVAQFASNPEPIYPIYASSCNHRHNFDGFLTYRETSDAVGSNTYLQIFRNGIFEAVDERLLRPYGEDPQGIASKIFEKVLIDALGRYLRVQRSMGTLPPIFIMLSLIGISGYIMHRKPIHWDEGHPIDRDILVIPEIMIEDFARNPSEVMKPAFDAIWNTAGWPRSLNYDQEGNWIGDN